MPSRGMSVGTATMTVSLSGTNLSAAYSGSGLALFYVLARGARYLAAANTTLENSLATAPPSGVANILAGALAGAQSTALGLASQAEDDASIVQYIQDNAIATLPAKSVDGTNPTDDIGLAIT